MVFNVSVGFQGLTNKAGKDEASKKYSLFVGDTVLVGDVSSTVLEHNIAYRSLAENRNTK